MPLSPTTDLTLPKWIKTWLQVTSFICIMDGTFVVFRPHTFPDGSLGIFFYGYKYYYEVDRMYGDLKDSFVYAQALCNWLEVILNLVCLYLNSKISKMTNVDDAVTVSTKTKLLTLVVTTMTFWKTVLYFLVYYNMDFRKHNSFLQEFILIFCLNGIWVLVPLLCMKYIFQELCGVKINSNHRIDERKKL